MERAAILGAGFISHSHAEALRFCGIELYAVVDRSEAAAESFASKWGIDTYGTSEAILFDETITTVHICTPPNTHYEIIKRLLDAGKNIICEKPLCFSDEEADELKQLAHEKGLKCAINLNVRYHNMSSKMKELIGQREAFGKVNLIHGKYLQQFHMLPTPYNWRYIPEVSGKMRAVTEIGTHWFDIVQYVTDLKITAVSALFGNFDPKRQVKEGLMYPIDEVEKEADIVDVTSEDVALIQFKFDNGAIGSVTLSEVSQGYSNYLEYEVTGVNQTAGWNSQSNNELYYNTTNSESNVLRDGFGNGFNDSFQQLIHSFYFANESEISYPTFDEGAEIVHICNAVYESAVNDSKWVQLK